MNLDQAWQAALAEIELQISRPNFVTWFAQSKLIEKSDGTALVGLPNNFAKEWIENRYQRIVLGALRNLDETTKKVDFVVSSTVKPQMLAKQELRRAPTDDAGQLSFGELKIDPETNLNPRYTLTSFVVGKSNELAFAAAQAIAQAPGHKYNPFFIYGGVGLGKTHLIQGMGNEIKTLHKNTINVRYVSSEKFTNDVIWAIKNKRMETIKEKYRFVDVLIIDDIQFIAEKPATIEEFFNTFNALYEANKQIIISSDRPPKFIPTLEDRLRSRFEGGVLADIGYPDYELRCAIIKTKVEEKALIVSDEIVTLIANKIQRSVREIEGVLNKILFYQTKRGEPVNNKTVEHIIEEVSEKPAKNISANHIIKTVASFYEISPLDLINRSRKKEIAESRQIAMFLLRDLLGLSYPYIGKRLGRRDHTTAMYACVKIGEEINRNQGLSHKILAIKDLISKA